MCRIIPHIHLTQIHRQKDEMFVGMLQSIWMGYCDEEDLDVLLRERNVDDGVVLFATKDRVREHNDRELDMLHHRPQPYNCIDSGQSQGDEQRFEERLVLKETMPVVLLANLDVENGICNGSQGRIVGFEPLKPEEEPKEPEEKNYKRDKVAYGVAMHKYRQVNQFKKTRNLFPIVEFSNGDTRVIRPDCSVFNVETMLKLDPVVGNFMQKVAAKARADASG
ncbi:ATP-dependent DNA helicase PIF1 [Colletotrichum musicola]|uniref:ATP-dependent DNA helicase PIF1 n=1 Tax=Colletotrichum musicola TaxID=2175873 RepID=A0A8H6MNT9_9PEZI|nr:ATP-dependent DNA helicase PIF1 [Colletotrichum musicola]